MHIREFFYFLETINIGTIQEVQRKHIQQFFTYLSSRKAVTTEKSLSSAHIAKYWQAIKSLNQYLRQTSQWGFTLPTKSIQVKSGIKAILSQQEVKCLYSLCDQTLLGIRDKAMLSLFYGCGLRRSEGIGLDLEDILLSKNVLCVRKGKNYKERYVPVSGAVANHLKQYLTESRPILLKSKPNHWHQCQRAFLISTRGERINDKTLTVRLRLLQERSGQKELQSKVISLHTLRHSIATHLLENGMSLRNIALFLGHNSIESTQIYAHITEEHLTN